MKLYRDLKAPTKHGKGTHIELDGNELAHAILAYLYAQDVVIDGSSTVTISTDVEAGEFGLCDRARVYVDPSGRVVYEGNVVKDPDEVEPAARWRDSEQRYRKALEAIAKIPGCGSTDVEAATDHAEEVLEGKNPEPWWL